MNSPNPYKTLPRTSFWRTASRRARAHDFTGLYAPRFAIDRTTRIATAGSCFAQHIGRRLRTGGFHYMDFEPAPTELLPETLQLRFGYGLFSARYGNIYTSRQLLTVLQAAVGHRELTELWEAGGRWYDPLRPAIEPDGFGSREELLAVRTGHYEAIRRLMKGIDVFVFTLGLTETWVHKPTGSAYQLCPGTTAGTFDPDLHAFHNAPYAEVLHELHNIVVWWRRLNPGVKFLFTVSPVPLAATATGTHVMLATAHSKAILRAVVSELCARHPFVDYFPSYEIVTSHIGRPQNFADDDREVRAVAVDDVMGCFFAAHGFAADDVAVAPSVALDAGTADNAAHDKTLVREMEIVCEEARLDMGDGPIGDGSAGDGNGGGAPGGRAGEIAAAVNVTPDIAARQAVEMPHEARRRRREARLARVARTAPGGASQDGPA